jgi:hypothetical protein
LFQCSRCKYMHYCDVQCQTMDWELHKIECKKFSMSINKNNMKMLNDEMTRMFLRLLIKIWVIFRFLYSRGLRFYRPCPYRTEFALLRKNHRKRSKSTISKRSSETVWYGMVRYGTVRYAMVRYGILGYGG